MIKEYVGTKSKSQNSSHRKSIFISIYIDHESLKVREIYFETPVTGIWYNFIELEGVYTLLSLFVWLYSSIFTDWMFVYKPYISIFVGLFWLSMTALWKNAILFNVPPYCGFIDIHWHSAPFSSKPRSFLMCPTALPTYYKPQKSLKERAVQVRLR